jgi:protein-disulfide isomerase
MTFPGRITEPDIFSVAERVGLDVTQLKQDMQAPNIEASIQRTRQLAAALGITGTPAFVIGDQLVPGALGLEQLRSFVRRAREKS